MWDVWQESALRRSLRRASAGVVFLGLALAVKAVFGVWEAGADERIDLPDRFREARVPAEAAYAPRAAPDQRLPMARPAGLLLLARHETPAHSSMPVSQSAPECR